MPRTKGVDSRPLFLSRREDGIEKETERGEGLSAILHGKPQQDDTALAYVDLDDGRTSGDDLFAFGQPLINTSLSPKCAADVASADARIS